MESTNNTVLVCKTKTISAQLLIHCTTTKTLLMFSTLHKPLGFQIHQIHFASSNYRGVLWGQWGKRMKWLLDHNEWRKMTDLWRQTRNIGVTSSWQNPGLQQVEVSSSSFVPSRCPPKPPWNTQLWHLFQPNNGVSSQWLCLATFRHFSFWYGNMAIISN